MDDRRYESDEPSADSLLLSVCGDVLAVAVERCPLCLRSRRPFYCKQCVNNGSFSRSSDDSERYSLLKQKLESLTNERCKLVESVGQKVASREAKAAKQYRIEELKRRNKLLKLVIEEARGKKKFAEKVYHKQHRACRKDAEKLQRSHESVPKMQATYDESMEKLHHRKLDLRERNLSLRDRRCCVINDLVQYVFPVVELTGDEATSYSLALEVSSLAMLSMAQQLSEACQLAYMSGQWVHTDRDGNTLIKIVESTLPGNGDYAAGVTGERPELASFAEDNERYTATNPTYAVISGLCYTTQLVQALASILCVNLPRKLHYSTFGCNDFSEKQLQRAVSQLNHNMLALCFSQGVDTSRLIARHTMRNLLLLLRSEHLGRDLAYTDSPKMVAAVNDGCESEDDSDKDDTDSPNDWDFVSRGDLPEMLVPVHASASWTYNTAAYAGHMLSGTQSTASDLVSSAAASVASLWRTATGTRSTDS